jgi:hypothetical protein
MAKTEAGYWLAVEPVLVQKVTTVSELQSILVTAISRGNPVVPTPTRQDFPRPAMERHCGLKSLSAFERTASWWSISQDVAGFRICEWRRSERYRGARDVGQHDEVKLPPETNLEEVVRIAAELAMTDRPAE